MTDVWCLIGHQEQIVELQYGDPRGNEKVSDEIFSAFKDGATQLVAFPKAFYNEALPGDGFYIDYVCDSIATTINCGIKALSTV